MNETGLEDSDWMGLEWNSWLSLDRSDGDLSTISSEPGLYRVRHRERDGLEYIGETGRSTRGRVGALARGVYAKEMPYRDPHTAAPCLWAVRDRYGPALEISYTVPPAADNSQERKTIEAAFIALARRETGTSPTANFGRIIEGYKQSSYSKAGITGGPLPEGETEPNSATGHGPVPWDNSEGVTESNWMGLEWSEPYRLEQRLEPELPKSGVYRIWYPGEDGLAYIGETAAFTDRLRSHEKSFGGEALFSVVAPTGMDAKHKRTEVETDLIGAHYLATQQAPAAQFGN